MGNVRKFKRKRFHAWKVWLIFIVFMLVAFFAFTAMFKVNRIYVKGTQRYSEEEMKSYLMEEAMDHNTLYLLYKCKYKEKPSIPFVQDFDLTFIDRNTLEVTIYEKVVTGCVKFMGEYMYFDKDGIIVETAKEKEDFVPEILGLDFSRIVMNEQLDIEKKDLFDTILNLTQLIKHYNIDVTSITFDSAYEITLACKDSIVLLGKHDFYDAPLSQLNNIFAANEGAFLYDLRKYEKPGDQFIAKKLK